MFGQYLLFLSVISYFLDTGFEAEECVRSRLFSGYFTRMGTGRGRGEGESRGGEGEEE